MAYAAQASSMFDLSTSVLQTTASSRHVKRADTRGNRSAAQGRLALVEVNASPPAPSILLAPSTQVRNAASAFVSTTVFECSDQTDAGNTSQNETQSVEQYIWTACWFLMGFLFLCST